ncbi:MAG: short-chain fatty acid transporter [Chitinophagales bacterium]|nr:short-chain fatty acid transporter [Chitinophagales bacterium]
MISFLEAYIRFVRRYLPLPFTIAIMLTFITFFLALVITPTSIIEISEGWYGGLTFGPYLTFTLQMILILVLGHILAVSKAFNFLIRGIVKFCSSNSKAALIVTFSTMVVSLVNWGLGLIFGAILARKVAEHAKASGINLNYPLIGAAGYSGLMIWHAGLSGSAPLVIATPDHFLEGTIGVLSTQSTLFSSMNIFAVFVSLIALSLLMYLLGKRKSEDFDKGASLRKSENTEEHDPEEGVRLDRSGLLSILFGGSMILFALYLSIIKPEHLGLEFLNLNFIILALFGFSITMHPGVTNFVRASNDAIKGSAGILIQFPLYFGILGIMKSSGLIEIFSSSLIQFSTLIPLEINVFISAAIVNLFVPSGGGQWAVQGPVVIEAANQYGLSYSKAVMALAYGDQITNMLQPFWALPLLAITGLKAKDILPYTFILFLVGSLIFIISLLLF